MGEVLEVVPEHLYAPLGSFRDIQGEKLLTILECFKVDREPEFL